LYAFFEEQKEGECNSKTENTYYDYFKTVLFLEKAHCVILVLPPLCVCDTHSGTVEKDWRIKLWSGILLIQTQWFYSGFSK